MAEDSEWNVHRKEWYNDRIMETYISAPVIDKQNDLIPTKTMEDAMDFYMKYGVYSFKHEEQPIGLPLAWKTEDGKVKVKVGIHSGLEMHDFAWKEIKEYGTRGTSSIRGEATAQKEVCDGDTCHNQIDELGLWSVSWVEDHPANPEAEVTQVAAMAKAVAKGCGCGGCGCGSKGKPENRETLKYNTDESDGKEGNPMTEKESEPEVVAPEEISEEKTEEVEEIKEEETTEEEIKEEEEEEEEVEADEDEEEEEVEASKDMSMVRDALMAALDYLAEDKMEEPLPEEEVEASADPLKEKELTLEKAIKALRKNGYTVYSGSKNTPAPKKIETPKSTYKFEDLISKDWDELERIERGM